MGHRRGIFYVAEDIWEAQSPELLELLESFDRYSSHRESAPMQPDNIRIVVTAVFDEFDEIRYGEPLPEYRFMFHRQPDGTITRDRAERMR